jgi:protein-S-isoprenylcysteine O-methyltransferase Ste14
MEKLRLHITQIFCIVLFLLLALTGSEWETQSTLVEATLFLGGALLVGIASLGRLWCSVYIAGYKTDNLITDGPYSVSRNPLYFFSLLGAIGVGLASETLLIPAIVLIAFIIYYPGVIKSEEREMGKNHGDMFEAYRTRVPRFFPKPSLLREPEFYITKPKVFKRHIFSALWFVWFIGITEFIEELHALHILPTLFTIY